MPNLDIEKICKSCSHQRSHHTYVTSEQNNNLKCGHADCECSNFVEWL